MVKIKHKKVHYSKEKKKDNKLDKRKKIKNNGKKAVNINKTKRNKSKKRKKVNRAHKIKIKNSLKYLSPICIDDNIYFFYDFEKIKNYKIFTNDMNKYKLNPEEISKINQLIDEINNNKNNIFIDTIQILPKYYKDFKKLQIIKRPINNKAKVIQEIIKENNGCINLSLRKIKNIYENKTSCKISISSISYILKYIFGYRYLRTIIKPKILSDLNFKRKSFFLIRLIYQILMHNMELIYIDESKIQLKNSNLRMWRGKKDLFNYGGIKQEKINLILAVSKNKAMHYEFNKKNTNSIIFKNFFVDMMKKLSPNEKRKFFFLWIMLAFIKEMK